MALRKGILGTFISKVSAAGLGMLMVVLVSRLLGAEGRGNVSLFISSVALLQMFCDFGNSSVIINLSYRIPARRLWLSSLIWVFSICVLSYGFLWFFREIPWVWLIPPAAFLYSLINLQQMLLMGRQKLAQRNISLLVLPSLNTLLFYLLYTHSGLGVTAYPVSLFCSLTGSALLTRIMLGSQLQIHTQGFVFETEILSQGLWVQSAQAIQFLNYRIHFFLVAFFTGQAALGIFNNAVVICESVWILGHSMGQVMHMKILNSTDVRAQISLTRKMILYNGAGSLLLCLILLSVPAGFWTFLFSEAFAGMKDLFIFLVPGVLAFSVSNIIAHYLHAGAYFRQILICNAFGLVSGLASALFLIPMNGLTGAALSWSAGLTASMFFYLFRFKIISRDIGENS